MIKRLNHVSVAVESIDDALTFYRDMLGLEVSEPVRLDDRQLRVVFVKIGDTQLELLEPTSPDNTVTRFLERRGPGTSPPDHTTVEGVPEADAKAPVRVTCGGVARGSGRSPGASSSLLGSRW